MTGRTGTSGSRYYCYDLNNVNTLYKGSWFCLSVLNMYVRLFKVQGGIGVHVDKSWQSWWDEEQAHIRRSGLTARLIEVLLSLRFFLYQYGLVYHLDISQQSKNFLVYVLSWIVLLAIFLLVKVNICI